MKYIKILLLTIFLLILLSLYNMIFKKKENFQSNKYFIGNKGESCNETCTKYGKECDTNAMKNSSVMASSQPPQILVDTRNNSGLINNGWREDVYTSGKRQRDGVNIRQFEYESLPGLWIRSSPTLEPQVHYKTDNIPGHSKCENKWDDLKRLCICGKNRRNIEVPYVPPPVPTPPPNPPPQKALVSRIRNATNYVPSVPLRPFPQKEFICNK